MKKIKISVVTPTIRPSLVEVTKECLSEQSFQDFEWLVEVGLGKEHDLNKAFNKMLRRAKGELIVFLQDSITINNDGLQKFWEAYQNNKNSFYTAAVGKKGVSGDISWDWRKHMLGSIDENQCEFDWGAAPTKALYEIGGFDEELDKWWSFDNVSVCKRAKMIGYFFENIDNPTVAYDHDLHIPHPFRKDYSPTMALLRMEDYEDNPVLEYLTLENETK